MKDVRIRDFLTPHEIKVAAAIYRKVEPSKRNATLVQKVIAPNIERINRALGQENDPSFLAYAVEYTFLKKPGYVCKGKNTPKGFGRSRNNAYNGDPEG
jgi:hypothetical protein